MLKSVGKQLVLYSIYLHYKYRGKHVYMYSTCLEHNVTLKTSMHIVVACCVSILILQTSACCLLNHTHTHTPLLCCTYIEHQLTPPHVLLPITAVSPPPHTPGPAQTEATSQPQPSVSLWEAARKWAMYCSSVNESMCVTLFVRMFPLFSGSHT